jgi:hypothetical protein
MKRRAVVVCFLPGQGLAQEMHALPKAEDSGQMEFHWVLHQYSSCLACCQCKSIPVWDAKCTIESDK